MVLSVALQPEVMAIYGQDEDGRPVKVEVLGRSLLAENFQVWRNLGKNKVWNLFFQRTFWLFALVSLVFSQQCSAFDFGSLIIRSFLISLTWCRQALLLMVSFLITGFLSTQLDEGSSNTLTIGGRSVTDADKLEFKFELEGADGTIQWVHGVLLEGAHPQNSFDHLTAVGLVRLLIGNNFKRVNSTSCQAS